MKFLTKIINFVKKAFSKIADMFKDKNPVEVINDATKTIAAAATAALAIYAGVNAIRVHLIPSAKKTNTNGAKSGHDIIIENRKTGSIDEKLTNLKMSSHNIGKKNPDNIGQEDLVVLKSIAKTRNSFFQSLSAEEQMNILEMEGFDFKSYSNEFKNSKSNRKRLFKSRKGFNKFGVIKTDKPFREEVDYGFFNFIMKPLDDFIHWIKNDPVPKKVPQIQLVDHPEIPDIPCDTALDLVSAAKNLDSYFNRNKTVSGEFNVSSSANLEEQQILAEEIFRHKTLRKFKKAVNMRMAQSQFNTPNIFDLMDDEIKDKGSKKKKKKKKHSSDNDGFYGFDDDSSKKKKKKNGMSKEDEKMESEADKRAKEHFRYHLEKAMKGEYDRKGYKFDF